MFNPQRLALARKRRKHTKKSLALAMGITPLTLTRLESGENQPEEETIQKISSVLEFPIKFFFDDDVEGINSDGVSFRSLSRLTTKDKEAALAASELGIMFSDWVCSRFNLPAVDVPDLSADYTAESAAMALREYWQLGQRPISDIIKLLESKGVIVLSLKEDIKTVDAFSFWRSDTPYIFLNSYKTVERSRFDAAHELGHLVMHVGCRLEHGKHTEQEADNFASCFLMPESDIRSEIRRNPTLNYLIEKKARWKTSLSSICYRLHKLEILTDWQFRQFCIQINQRFKETEPNSIETISSTLWDKVFRELWSKKITKLSISKELNIPYDEIEKLVVFRNDNYKNTRNDSNINLVSIK